MLRRGGFPVAQPIGHRWLLYAQGPGGASLGDVVLQHKNPEFLQAVGKPHAATDSYRSLSGQAFSPIASATASIKDRYVLSREVSSALSAHVVKLLNEELRARKRSRKYSQNTMAKDIGVPGGTLSGIMTGAKGIGDDVLPKIATFLKRTRDELEADLETLSAVETSRSDATAAAQVQQGAISLDRVRHWLYKRYDKTVVDETIARFYPTGATTVSELDTLDVLDHQIRMAFGSHRKAGEEPTALPKDEARKSTEHPSLTPIQRESVDRQAKQLAKSSATRRGKHAGK